MGYCQQGASCDLRHLRECPDYGGSSGCKSKQCSLPHVDRGSHMRRHASNQTANSEVMDVDGDAAKHEVQDDIDSDASSDTFQEPESIFAISVDDITEQDFVGLY